MEIRIKGQRRTEVQNRPVPDAGGSSGGEGREAGGRGGRGGLSSLPPRACVCVCVFAADQMSVSRRETAGENSALPRPPSAE